MDPTSGKSDFSVTTEDKKAVHRPDPRQNTYLGFLKKHKISIALSSCFLLLGFSLGYVIQESISGKSSNADIVFDLDSKIITQRTVVAKGEISKVNNDGMVVMPIGMSEQEQELYKYDISIDSQSDIYLQIQDASTKETTSAEKTSLGKLLPGDVVNIIMSVEDDGSVRTSTISAIRTK